MGLKEKVKAIRHDLNIDRESPFLMISELLSGISIIISNEKYQPLTKTSIWPGFQVETL